MGKIIDHMKARGWDENELREGLSGMFPVFNDDAIIPELKILTDSSVRAFEKVKVVSKKESWGAVMIDATEAAKNIVLSIFSEQEAKNAFNSLLLKLAEASEKKERTLHALMMLIDEAARMYGQPIPARGDWLFQPLASISPPELVEIHPPL